MVNILQQCPKEKALKAAEAWRDRHPGDRSTFVLIRNGTAFTAVDYLEHSRREGIDVQAVGLNKDVWTVLAMAENECPVCGLPLPDKVLFDEWGYFHCEESDCGARLLVDAEGKPAASLHKS